MIQQSDSEVNINKMCIEKYSVYISECVSNGIAFT